MANKEFFSVGDLWITKGIRAGKRKLLAKVLKFYVVAPAAKVTNRYFASAAMHNGAYTLANGGLPGDTLPHSVTMVVTDVDVADTRGIITILGTDIEGKIISEDMTPGANSVIVESLNTFKTITSITGSGWAQGGTTADNIIIGFGDKQGLPDYIVAAGDILLVALDTALVNAPTVAVDAAVLAKNCITVVGDGTKKMRVLYQL